QAQLMFSQYVDGSSNKKGLEIYNPDGTTVNLADYEIQQFNNGGTAKTATFRLQGSLTSKQKFLVGRSELQAELGSKVNQVAALSFNGDDAVVLVYKGTPVDRFGRIGERPEAGWGTAVSSLGNSFKRNETENPALSIDATATFDLDRSWSAWTNRNDFSNLSGSITQPPVETVSCSSSDTPIADLATAAQNQIYTVRGVITADYRYANGFSGFYVQTPDTKARANVSNAIFVYIPN
ncbi:lamin tail domain-containing protein, partial [Acinetobacter baumannii]